MRDPDSTSSGRLKRGLTIAGALAAFLVTVELCARVDDYVRYGAPLLACYSADSLRSSAEGIPFNVPLATFEKWHNNSHGFRGQEVSLAKPAGKTRVVCLGSSESYGLYESAGKEWPAQLQQLLAGQGYEVINASVAGLSLKKYRQYFESYVAPFSPDVVVLVINPLFYFTALERGGAGDRTPAKKVSSRKTADPAPVQKPELRALPKAKQALKQAAASSFPELLKRWQLRSLREQLARIEQQRLKGREAKDAVPLNHLVTFHGELSETVAAMRSRGARVVLTTYPSLIGRDNLDRYPEIFLDNRRFCIELSLCGMADAFDRFNAVIASVAAEQGTMLVDGRLLIPRTTEYFGDNVHYKDRGARLFAEGVAETLRKGSGGSSPQLPRNQPATMMVVN